MRKITGQVGIGRWRFYFGVGGWRYRAGKMPQRGYIRLQKHKS